MELKQPTADVGIIVGRFQVPDLHVAHKNLIRSVCERHHKVIIFLGLSPVFDSKDPLDFEVRKLMINEAFPDVIVAYITDMKDDRKWSEKLDEQIGHLLGPKQSALLYGSRDSFISHYHGKHQSAELVQEHWVSGSEIRAMVKNKVQPSRDFRHGAIWESWQRYDTVYTTVDIAVLDDKGKILLARKKNEEGWRFIGGFSDPKDESFEASANRELREEIPNAECDIITKERYLGSYNIEDWRYRGKNDRIRTMLFWTVYLFGNCGAGDDIAETKWFDVKTFRASKWAESGLETEHPIKQLIVPEHHVLMEALIASFDCIKPKKRSTENG